MKKALATIGIIALSILQYLTPVSAADNTTTPYADTGKFLVTIPKTIMLNSNKEASYTISITGNAYEGESVTVAPDSSFTLRDNYGKTDVTATVTQEKTKFTESDINGTVKANKQTTGSIKAYELTAGEWNGSLNFKISETSHAWDNGTTTAATCTTAGVIKYTCKGCGKTKDVSIPALGHVSVSANNGKAATCLSEGKTSDTICSRCNSVLIKGSVIAKTAHKWNDDICSVCRTKISPGLYDKDGNLLCSWAASGIDVSLDPVSGVNVSKAARTIINNNFPTTTRVVIPDGVTKIGKNQFFQLKNITRVDIPNSVTTIGDGAFCYCSSLVINKLPSSLTTIEDYAFQGTICTTITIPKNVSFIGECAFCLTGLKKAIFEDPSGRWYVRQPYDGYESSYTDVYTPSLNSTFADSTAAANFLLSLADYNYKLAVLRK